jgi:hypothetical protein
MSGSESSLLDEQTLGRLQFFSESVTPPTVPRPIALINQELARGYVLILSGTFDFIFYLGSTRPFDGGLANFSLLVMALIMRILLVQRGEHNIELELRFSRHGGYVFHDSRGFEAGDDMELKIVQEFVRRRSREGSLNDRLHAIWFVLFGVYSPIFTKFGV